MKKITLRHEFDCSVERFWEVFFDKDFNTTLFRDELGFPDYRIVEQTDSEAEVRRCVCGQPKLNVPAAVAKLLGDKFSYEEEGRLDKKTMRWTWSMKPSTLQGKLVQGGNLRVEPVGDGRCRRVTEIEIEAKVFGIGGLLESTTEKQMIDGWNKSAVFMAKWLAEHR